jgi:AcrR family transcriptional regulator
LALAGLTSSPILLAWMAVLVVIVVVVMNNDPKGEQCSCQVLVFSVRNSQTRRMTTSAPRTARERVREEMTSEILAVARDHVAREGAAALSLRSVARDLGMAPSALYRYFDGRDALLSALILSAYESLATEAERSAAEPTAQAGGDAPRWKVVPRALRAWALARPHEWGLIFGTPIPGYHAPHDTVVPYARIADAMMRPLVDANRGGRLVSGSGPSTQPVADALRDAMAPISDGLFPGVPVHDVVKAVEAWTTVVGAVSLEVFGHWRNTILEPGEYFEAVLDDLAVMLGLSSG